MKVPPKTDSAILQWMDANKMVTSDGRRFEWVQHSFLLQPLCDWNKRIVIKKAAQIGFSESFGIMKSIFAAKHYGWNIIYTLPSDSFAEQFATTKVDPIVDANPILKSFVGPGKSVKKIGTHFIYYRGTISNKPKGSKFEGDKAISFTSDLNVHDERDRSDQMTIEQYESRIENSEYGGIWSFSNPTYPGVGTDGLYELSDQKVWMVKCEACNHYQWLDWVKLGEMSGVQNHCYIDPEKKIFTCSKCGRELDDLTRMKGEWVPKKIFNSDVSGYWMSQLNYVRKDLAGLLKKEKGQQKQNFYNFTLGRAYRGTDIVVERKTIIKNINITENKRQGMALGVDNGIWKHYVLGNMTGICEVGKTKDWNVIEDLIKKYKPVTVIDGNPYPNYPRELTKKYKGMVFMSFYKKDKDLMDAFDFKSAADRGVVHIQRTKYIDMLVDKFNNRQKPINILERDLDEYIQHWETLSRQEVADSMGIIRGEWVSSNGKDHYAHATVYQDVALQKIMKRHGIVAEDLPKVQEQQKAIEIDEMGRGTLPSIEELISGSIDDIDDWRYN